MIDVLVKLKGGELISLLIQRLKIASSKPLTREAVVAQNRTFIDLHNTLKICECPAVAVI